MGSNRMWMALTLSLTFLLTGACASAQTWDEILNQKKTQKKYLLQQITALQVYIGYAKKGYDLVGNGVHAVKNISQGEFSLHQKFFSSLAAVSPSVRNSSEVAEVLDGSLAIISVVKGWQGAKLTANDWAFVALVKANLLAECASELEALLLVVTSGKWKMTDDERIGRIEKLRLSMQDKYSFAVSFTGEMQTLARQRKQEKKSIYEIRRLHEIQ